MRALVFFRGCEEKGEGPATRGWMCEKGGLCDVTLRFWVLASLFGNAQDSDAGAARQQ